MRLWAFALVTMMLPACGHSTDQTAQPVALPARTPIVTPLVLALPEGDAGARFKAAVKQMDAGQLAEAADTLEELRRRQPDNAPIVHELGLAYRLLKQPEKAIALWTPLRARLPVDTLASLASALDEAGKAREAQSLLRDELAHHAESGILYSELATSLLNAGNKEEALTLYEQAIKVDPPFRASYLHAAEILAGTRSRGMTLLYGETFRVLEPTGERSAAIGRLMVRVCKEAVQLGASTPGGTKAHVSLAPDIVLNADAKRGAGDLPVVNLFELAFGPGLVIAHTSGLSLASLHEARRLFLDLVNSKIKDSSLAAMPIMRWLRSLDAAGHLEAYDYWLYAPAMQDEAIAWFKAHKSETEAMATYLAEHPLFSPK